TTIATLGASIGAHAQGDVSFDITTPHVTDETTFNEQLVLADGATQLGNVTLALTVVPDMVDPTSSDADDQYDQQVSGGCSSTGRSSASIALVLLVLRRRRRV